MFECPKILLFQYTLISINMRYPKINFSNYKKIYIVLK